MFPSKSNLEGAVGRMFYSLSKNIDDYKTVIEYINNSVSKENFFNIASEIAHTYEDYCDQYILNDFISRLSEKLFKK